MSSSQKFQTLLLVGGFAGMGAGAVFGLTVGAEEFAGLSSWMISGSVMDGAMFGGTLGLAAGATAGTYVNLKDYLSRDEGKDPIYSCPRP
jgi:hypothetical protein